MEAIFIWPFELISQGFSFPHFDFLLNFFLNFYMMQRAQATLALTLVEVLTTRHHSKESRPEIQKSSGGGWGTQNGGGLLFPMLLLS